MYTCKDCLHYNACKSMYIHGLDEYTAVMNYQEDMFDNEHYADVYNCEDFTHEDEWVHLPCKVGDTLYEITSRKTISEYQVTAIRIELFGTFIDWKITQGFVDRYISDMPAGEIGKTVFIIREEAENKLKEIKGD